MTTDLQVLGLYFDAVGVLVLAIPVVLTRQSEIKAQAGSGSGENLDVVKALLLNKLDLSAGSFLLLTGFLLQLLSVYEVSIGEWLSWVVVLAGALLIGVYFGSFRAYYVDRYLISTFPDNQNPPLFRKSRKK